MCSRACGRAGRRSGTGVEAEETQMQADARFSGRAFPRARPHCPCAGAADPSSIWLFALL